MTDVSSALSRPFTSGARPSLRIDGRVVSMALVAFVTLSVYLRQVVHWRQATLFLVGGVLGVVLYHAAFGFTSSWRVLISDRRGAGVRGQMLMLAVACALFFPALGSGSPLLTDTIRGNVSPLGISGRRRRVLVWPRHAARRRMRLGHALYRWRREYPHAGDARRLHCRFCRWSGTRAVVAIVACTGRGLSGRVIWPLGSAGRQPSLRSARFPLAPSSSSADGTVDLFGVQHRFGAASRAS